MPVETEPWRPTRGGLALLARELTEWGWDRDNRWSPNALEFFPDQTYADFDPATLGAFSGIEGLAGGASPSQTAASYLGDVLGGGYLPGGENANPYTEQMRASITEPMMERFNEVLMPGMQQQWFGAHGGASPGMVQSVGREARQALDEINRTEGSLMGGLWDQERGRMQAAAGMSPGIEAGMYTPFEMLRGVGADREAQAQRGINEEMARHEFAQTEPITRLGMISPMLGGLGAQFPEQQMKDMGSGGGLGGTLGAIGGGLLSLGGSALAGGMFGPGGTFGGTTPSAGTGGQSIFGANNSATLSPFFGSPWANPFAMYG